MKALHLTNLIILMNLYLYVMYRDVIECEAERENNKEIECENDEKHFYLYPNGDGRGLGIKVAIKNYKDVNDVIFTFCSEITAWMVKNIEKDDKQYDLAVKYLSDICTTTDKENHGFRLVNEYGVRILDLSKDVIGNGEKVFLVPRGLHFVWPLIKPGNVFTPKNVDPPIPEKPIRLIQLTNSPRVFQVENFMTEEEMDEILENNKDKMKPSEVGFSGWKDSTRTSSTSFDSTSEAGKAIMNRTFKLLGMDFDESIGHNLQVLKYEPGQWYKPHVDYFGDDSFEDNKPILNNGSNRFATMFVYFTDVTEGGHTVFPLSTTHLSYNGEKLVHDGTVDTPGYIKSEEAYYCCNVSSSALRSAPVRGNAVLFYSQHADGRLDPYSLHGGCPPVSGIKWSGNVWVWNRSIPDRSIAKDKMFSQQEKPAVVIFQNNNSHNEKIKLVWDGENGENISVGTIVNLDDVDEMGEIEPGSEMTLNTFEGHVFHAIAINSNLVRFTYVVPSYQSPSSKNNENESEEEEEDDDEEETKEIIVNITW